MFRLGQGSKLIKYHLGYRLVIDFNRHAQSMYQFMHTLNFIVKANSNIINISGLDSTRGPNTKGTIIGHMDDTPTNTAAILSVRPTKIHCTAGFLYSYINRQLSLTILTIILAVFSALSPFCTNIWLLYASVFIASIGGGAWDSGNSVWTIELWKENSPPVLQLAQMMFGLGNILSPIIARDYLLGDMSNCTDAVDYSLQVTGLGRHYFNRHHPKHHPHTHRPPPHHLTTTVAPFVCPDDDPINYSIDRRPRLKVPFLIAGGVTLIVPVIWIIMFAIKRYQVPKTRERVDSRVADPTGKTVQKITTDKSPILMPARRTKIILIILVGMSLNSYSAMEQSFLNNSSTYYQYLPIRLSAQEAADVLSVMTSTYTVGRLISAFIASKLSAEVMLVYHSVIICVSMAILQFGQHSKAFIWAGNALIGFGYSAMWPSYIAFGEKYIKSQRYPETSTLGLCAVIFAPTTIDMMHVFDTTMARISLVGVGTNIGYLTGSFIGFTYKWVNRQLAITVTTAMLGVFTLLAPLCPNVTLLILCMFLGSIGSGCFDSSNAVWVIEMWDSKSPSVLMLGQMMYGLGSILAPVLARPFVSTDTEPTDGTTLASVTTEAPIDYTYRRQQLVIPYMIAGGTTLIVPTIFLLMRYKQPESETIKSDEKTHQANLSQATDSGNNSLALIERALALASYNALEGVHMGSLPTYLHYLPLVNISSQRAADVMTLMTSTYTVGRLICAYISLKLRPEIMITYHTILIFISILIMQFGKTSMVAIWVANGIIGFGFCAMWTSFWILAENCAKLDNTITSIFCITATVFNLVSPFVIGPLIEKHPEVFLYLEMAYLALTIFLFIILMIIVRMSRQNR
ncbi:unnamed protein product [Medioppia subpectinata]|uniref:Sodium-dependent glucose transporter 1 n=1 Tax=Medioppia subpectinata TaxID=1979941 RepID=A0A7R9Q1F4_9ACAR|nr:unnamed protein product [Medioppia subpectinata]CAG2109152.1 unnamed protein product [Medioppia subpectinata]